MNFYRRQIGYDLSSLMFGLSSITSIMCAVVADWLNLEALLTISATFLVMSTFFCVIYVALGFMKYRDDDIILNYLGNTPRSDDLMTTSDIRYCERLLRDEIKVGCYFTEFQYALTTYLKVSGEAYQNNTEQRNKQDRDAGKICDKVVEFLRSPGSVAFFEKNQAKSLRKKSCQYCRQSSHHPDKSHSGPHQTSRVLPETYYCSH